MSKIDKEKDYVDVADIMTVDIVVIRKFCLRCDKFRPTNNSCAGNISLENQARYAARDWCGWAIKGGVSGTMTDKGFKASKVTE